MRIAALLIVACVGQIAAGDTKLPPMNEQQISSIRLLVRETEQRDSELHARLEDAQRRLTAAYTQFELDEEQIDELQKLIVDLQQDLLTNYRKLQRGVRKIVGPERFQQLQIRIALLMKSRDEQRRKNAAGDASSLPGTSPVQPH